MDFGWSIRFPQPHRAPFGEGVGSGPGRAGGGCSHSSGSPTGALGGSEGGLPALVKVLLGPIFRICVYRSLQVGFAVCSGCSPFGYERRGGVQGGCHVDMMVLPSALEGRGVRNHWSGLPRPLQRIRFNDLRLQGGSNDVHSGDDTYGT